MLVTGSLLGPYEILAPLGAGGMGQVYLAEQISLKRKVALKLLHPDMAGNERSLLRFKAEAENVARATHANIVQIYTIGQANGINYIALEYVDGKNLREYLEKKGTPELSLGLHIMAQVAAALQRAGELGVIHRDVKPGNVLVTPEGDAKLSDLGLAGPMYANAENDPRHGKIVGTADYLSPDHIVSPWDPKPTWDIYSLGCTLYYATTGKVPFPGGTTKQKADAHVNQKPLDPRRLNHQLSDAFVDGRPDDPGVPGNDAEVLFECEKRQ